MRKRSWNFYFGLAVGVHALLCGLFVLAGLDWLNKDQEEKTAIEIGFVEEATVHDMTGQSAGGASSAEKAGPAIKSVSVTAVEALQSLRGHAEMSQSSAQKSVDCAEAIEKAAAALDHPKAAEDARGENRAAAGNGTTENASQNGGNAGTVGAASNFPGLGDGFSPNGDGTYTAASSAGISYQLLRDADAVYPDEARSIGYNNIVEVVARIMVGLDGTVESVEILNTPPNLGFCEAAQEALWGMRFAPIYYQGVNIRVPFEKHLIFQP